MEEVLHVLAWVERAAADLGLPINQEKSELIRTNSSTREAVLSVAPCLRPADSSADLPLVAPLGWTTPSGQIESPLK